MPSSSPPATQWLESLLLMRPLGGLIWRILRDIHKKCSSRPLSRDPLVEDLGEFCDTFAKNALQEVLFSSGLAKGVWDHTILPGGV